MERRRAREIGFTYKIGSTASAISANFMAVERIKIVQNFKILQWFDSGINRQVATLRGLRSADLTGQCSGSLILGGCITGARRACTAVVESFYPNWEERGRI